MDVPVTREEVTVERRPVERHPSDRPIDETGRTIEVPVREERVDVEKRPVVYEEVGVGKRQVTETQSVSDTVRREEARIQREGDVNVRGWNEAMPTYRQRWQQRYGTTATEPPFALVARVVKRAAAKRKRYTRRSAPYDPYNPYNSYSHAAVRVVRTS